MGSQSCLKSKREGIPPDVIEVLNLSGVHKPQLTKFILECMQTSDSLKLDAAFFMIANLHKNYTAYYKLVDSTGNSYQINPEDYNNLKEIMNYIDSLEYKFGVLSYTADSFAIDYSRISSEFLSENLKQSFFSWKNSKLGLTYDFETYKKFILPFKVDNENIEPFREFLSNEFIGIIDSSKSFSDNIISLNNKINSLIYYDERYIRNLPVQPIQELLKNGKGNLTDINILKVKILRSLGIAATMDYTPFIADSSGWYAWTTVFSPEGQEIRLDIKNGKLENLINGRIAKVYRRTYFADSTSLFAKKNIKESTARFLGHFNYFDVSNSYFETIDYSIYHSSTNKYLYVSVFNDGDWKPVDWAPNNNGQVNFTELGKEIIYLPLDWNKDNSKSIGNPFQIKDDIIIEYSPDERYHNISLIYTAQKTPIISEKTYKLYYWDDEWKLLNSDRSNKGVILARVPIQCVLLLSENDRLYNKRIFVIENGVQVFH